MCYAISRREFLNGEMPLHRTVVVQGTASLESNESVEVVGI